VTSNVDAELRANIKQTDAFIKSHPYKRNIVLSRQDKVDDGAGGWTSAPAVIGSPSEMALVPSATQLPVRRTLDGQEVTPEYTLIARHTADIRNGDWFWVDGIKYEVVFVFPNKSYEIKAEVIYRG
jgi:hypothetical protein